MRISDRGSADRGSAGGPVRRGGYSLLTVLMMLTLLGIAVSGLLFFITQSVHTSSSMIERRRVFYTCDGISRQLIGFSQAFLAKNTLEDVPESVLQQDLRSHLPNLVPAGFVVGDNDLVVPEKALPVPVPVETISNGPFAGLQAKIQTIDIALQATKTVTGAVCRTEQSLSLGRIALFQFFVFVDQPLLDLVPPVGETLFMRGRIHTNGRVCLGGAPFAADAGRFAVRLDSRVTAVERITQAAAGGCQLGGFGEAGIINFRAPGEQVPGQPDRLGNPFLYDGLGALESSGCTSAGAVCSGGWRSYAIAHWLGRVQDRDHTVPELTLPVSPQAFNSQAGIAADGSLVPQRMHIGPLRPSTRFLVEPQLTNDPPGFGRNKMAFKAQIRIIDGVWYVKDPGDNNAPDETGDDGPWPGIPIWSDHPGEFTTAVASMGREGVEGATPLEVGQSDIRANIEERANDDARLQKAVWSKRFDVSGASPTPRRFSYYAHVDRRQADNDAVNGAVLSPQGAGLQYGRVCPTTTIPGPSGFATSVRACDADPPGVISYGAISPVQLTPAGGSNQVYWQPGFRYVNNDFVPKKKKKKAAGEAGWCGGRTTSGIGDEVRQSQTDSAALLPVRSVDIDGNVIFSEFPVPGAPLPGDGDDIAWSGGDPSAASVLVAGRVCSDDNDAEMRHRARLALLAGTRTGFSDTNNQPDTRLRPGAQPDILPVNFDVHAFQEALADRTPGELGSYFCRGCLWDRFDGSVFITNTWGGSMLGAATFPEGQASAPPNPRVDDAQQPRPFKEMKSSTGPLPYPLCAAPSDESGTALAQLVGHRFLDADERPGAPGFAEPYTQNNSGANPKPYDFERLPPFRPKNPTTLAQPEPTPTLSLPPDVANEAAPFRGSFTIPACASYSLATPGPFATVRPTAVRVINARVLNQNADKCGNNRNQPCLPRLSRATTNVTGGEARLPDGLNIITNVPAYITGDVNQTSEIIDVQTGAKATDWVPFMIAADSITTLSNAWDDDASRWDVATDDGALAPPGDTTIRPAASTRFNMLLLTGINAAGVFVGDTSAIRNLPETGGGLPNVMRLMENWGAESTLHQFRGAIVVGWSPVYTHWKVGRVGRGTYTPPLVRDWQFDRHLNATINQPPDSPVFDVSAIRSWRRE